MLFVSCCCAVLVIENPIHLFTLHEYFTNIVLCISKYVLSQTTATTTTPTCREYMQIQHHATCLATFGQQWRYLLCGHVQAHKVQHMLERLSLLLLCRSISILSLWQLKLVSCCCWPQYSTQNVLQLFIDIRNLLSASGPNSYTCVHYTTRT